MLARRTLEFTTGSVLEKKWDDNHAVLLEHRRGNQGGPSATKADGESPLEELFGDNEAILRERCVPVLAVVIEIIDACGLEKRRGHMAVRRDHRDASVQQSPEFRA